MDFKQKNILVLAPHTDDGELGCGATIAKAIRAGATVTYIAFSAAEESVDSGFPADQLVTEVKEATAVLGVKPENLIVYRYKVRKLNFVRQEILEKLIALRPQINPDIVFIPSQTDIHQDHSTIAEEGIRAFKYTNILGYELVWNNLSFKTDCFITVDQQDLDLKIKALSCYKTQAGKSYMDPEFHQSLARVRGVQMGGVYAEAFQVIRWIIR